MVLKRGICGLLWGLVMLVSVPSSGVGQAGPVEIPSAKRHPKIDGRIDKGEWTEAAEFEIGYEVSPGENIPAPVKTLVWISYDRNHLYLAFRCFDPKPEEIRAHYRDHDEIWSDDWVEVVLDTFNDQRRAYEFGVNPLGVQLDAINDDVNSSYDISWDAIWDSAGLLTPEGWEVEISIPFNQLRFPDHEGPQVWGLDLVRQYPRSVRHHLGLFPRLRGSNSYLSQEVKITGLVGIRGGKDLEVSPTLTGNMTREKPDFPSGDWETDSAVDAGLTLGWGVTPNMTLAAAVNPDFSQVEADALQLDINTTFALFYPEARPFFLVGVDTFNTDLPLLHTRTIADPSFALKWTGKVGRQTFGVFSARDDVTNVIVPGAEGSMMGSFSERNTASVGRYRLDFGENSAAGFMLTDREGEGGYFNRVYSGDLRYRLSRRDEVTANLAWSESRYNDSMVGYFGLGDPDASGHASSLRYRHTGREWQWFFSYSDSTEGFRADLGFKPQVDYRRYFASAGHRWWGGADRWFTSIYAGCNNLYEERSSDSGFSSRSLGCSLVYSGPLQSTVRLSANLAEQLYDSKHFLDDSLVLSLGIRPNEVFSLFLFAFYGDGIDYAAVLPATRSGLSPSVSIHAGRHLSFDLQQNWAHLDREEGRLYSTSVTYFRSVYQFNRRSFLRMILQYARVDRNPEMYSAMVDDSSETLLTQLLFSYKINPRTLLYLGYSDSGYGTRDIALARQNQSIFIKLGYAFLF